MKTTIMNKRLLLIPSIFCIMLFTLLCQNIDATPCYYPNWTDCSDSCASFSSYSIFYDGQEGWTYCQCLSSSYGEYEFCEEVESGTCWEEWEVNEILCLTEATWTYLGPMANQQCDLSGM